MGEANARGDFEDRKAEAEKRDAGEDCEVLMFFKHAEGKLNIQALPRDEVPDQDSPAVIVASFIMENLKELIDAAMTSKESVEQGGEIGHKLRLRHPNGGWVN